MNGAARRIASITAATAMTVSIAIPAAAARDSDGHAAGAYGDRPGSRSDGHEGRDTWSHEADRRSPEVPLQEWTDEARRGVSTGADTALHRVRSRSDRAHGQAARSALQAAFEQQQNAYLAHLRRVEAFLTGLSDRVASSDLDPQVKANLLAIIADRRATIADLTHQVLAAATVDDLATVRQHALVDLAGGDDD